MNMLGRQRQNREQYINNHVTEAAMTAAVNIRDRLADDEIGPYAVPLGKVPRGIEASAYAERLGGAVETMLDAMDCRVVEVDRAITQYTSRIKPRRTHTPIHRPEQSGPRVMFRRKAEAPGR